MHSSFHAVLDIIFPRELRDYFELTSHSVTEEQMHFYLQEVNTPPTEFKGSNLLSKGFYEPITIQDFPIRGCQVFYHVKRRRWLNTDTNQTVFRDWQLVARGTRVTKDFAAFLKEIGRY